MHPSYAALWVRSRGDLPKWLSLNTTPLAPGPERLADTISMMRGYKIKKESINGGFGKTFGDS